MLTELREKSQSFLIFVLFGMLIVVFIFFFGPQVDGMAPGSAPSDGSDWAVNVNGTELSRREVEMSVRRAAMSMDIGDEELPILRREAAEQAAEGAIVEQRARAMGVVPSDTAVSRYIVGEDNQDGPLFRKNGKFDKELYTARVGQSFGASLDLYRRSKERELVVKRHLRLLANLVQVSEAEIRGQYDRATRKWNLEYLVIDPAEVAPAGPEPTPEEGTAFAAGHTKEVEAYYAAHKRDYDREKEVKIRRILLKVEPGAADGAKAEIRKRIETIRAEASAPGADFEAIAKEKSEDYYKAFGGDMGWQGKENTSAQDYEVYAKLEAGQVSDINSSPVGLWFVKADEVKPALKKTLDEVRGEIGVILAREGRRTDAARAAGAAMLDRVKAGATLAEVAPTPPPPPAEGDTGGETPEPPSAVKTTGLFADSRIPYDRFPGLGTSAELARLLAGLTSEKPLVEKLIEIDGKLHLVRLKERVDPTDEGFAKERDAYEIRMRMRRGGQIFGNWEQILFGPAQFRAQGMFAGGGALLAELETKPGKVSFNEAAYPAPPAPAAP